MTGKSLLRAYRVTVAFVVYMALGGLGVSALAAAAAANGFMVLVLSVVGLGLWAAGLAVVMAEQ